jgi:farnesyl-diphosphate farnesyltransferase
MASRPPFTRLLKDVSRSFYLTMRVLPEAIRPPISLAYLLARTTDTVADTAVVPLEQRLDILRCMSDRILGHTEITPDFQALAPHQSNAAEAELLFRFPEALQALDEATPQDRELIRQVLSVIVGGQELDLQRFARAGREHPIALRDDTELDDYTYRVAGCVGEFWTRLWLAHLFKQGLVINEPLFLAQGVRFGKGLQMVNILRDLPTDLCQGRCYVPLDRLQALGLLPADLLSPDAEPRFRPLYEEYLSLAASHLAAGWDYTTSLPRSGIRVRLACAWPILIGVKTLARLGSSPILAARKPAKVPRSQVYGIIARTILLYPWSEMWKRLFSECRGL